MVTNTHPLLLLVSGAHLQPTWILKTFLFFSVYSIVLFWIQHPAVLPCFMVNGTPSSTLLSCEYNTLLYSGFQQMQHTAYYFLKWALNVITKRWVPPPPPPPPPPHFCTIIHKNWQAPASATQFTALVCFLFLSLTRLYYAVHANMHLKRQPHPSHGVINFIRVTTTSVHLNLHQSPEHGHNHENNPTRHTAETQQSQTKNTTLQCAPILTNNNFTTECPWILNLSIKCAQTH